MNGLKLLNIALIALIITFAIQLFIAPPQQKVAENTISMAVVKKSVDVPNLPQVNIHNTKNTEFSYNTCSDLQLFLNSEAAKLETFENFCKDVIVPAGATQKIDFSPLQNLFTKRTGEYGLTLSTKQTDTTDAVQGHVSFKVEQPGFIKSFFINLIYEPIYNLFAGILSVLPGHPLGWAIVILTIIIRLVLLVPQHKMLENSRKLAELNPKIRALQKEYAEDRAQMGMKMMELYKKEGVSPMGSCLPLLIQMPILIVLYWVILGITDNANTYHLYSFLQGFNPANINVHFFGVDLLQIGWVLAIGMGILLGATQWIQSYLSIKAQPALPKKEEKKETKEWEMPQLDPRMMQNMMLYFLPLVIGISALFFPLGLGLYWWIGLLFMIVQQWFVNSRAKKKKEKGEIIRKK